MTQPITQFEAVMINQGNSLKEFINIQPTVNDVMMKQALTLIDEGIALAIQAAKESDDGNSLCDHPHMHKIKPFKNS